MHASSGARGGNAGIEASPEDIEVTSLPPDGGTIPPSITVFRPETGYGALLGLAGAAFSAVLTAFLVMRGLDESVRLHQMLPFLAAAVTAGTFCLIAYWTFGILTLRYVVDRSALSIRWGDLQQVIPLEKIERLVPGGELEPPVIEGLNWPGHHVGRAYVQPVGDVLFYSAHRTPAEILYIETPEQTYGISVPDQQIFLQSIQEAQTRGPLFDQSQAVHRRGIAAQSFWMDPGAIVLALLLIGTFFSVLGFVLHQYPGLPATVALRFPSLGGVVRSGHKSDLLDIPRSGLGFLAINLVLAVLLHSWERMVGYALLVAGIALQIGLLIAAALAVA